MAYIPKDVEWFVADLVKEIRVQGYTRNIVHINYVLIQARTPAEAYRKAVKLGKRLNQTYRNPQRKTVTIRFLGLHNLDAIFEPLEHGCEIMFVERLGIGRAGLRKLVRRRRELQAFMPIRHRNGRPDYSSKEIMDEVGRHLEKGKAQRISKQRRIQPRSGIPPAHRRR